MAIKAVATVTISCYRDIQSITRYYLLQSSTVTAPSKPTANPPDSDWSDSEPSYTSGSTNTLYFCDLNVFSDGTWEYSTVSKSSSYEAAKEAYNKAVAAGNAADEANTKIEEVSDNLSISTDIIIGTQTAVTGSWTGVAKFASLKDGQQISYWLPYSGSGNATLNLTLSTGSTTGAIKCYYGGTNGLTTHYPAGSLIRMTYRSGVSINGSSTKYTGWWCDANYDSGNTYDRVKYNGAIKAGSTAIVAGNIIVAGASNAGTYTHLKLGNTFDVTYPILYANASISAGSTGTYNYTVYPFTVTTTQSITLTAYKPVYIKGTLSGVNFTPISTTPLTQTVPTSEDGYKYILLGTAYSTTQMYLAPEHPIFQYYDGDFKSVEQIAIEALTKIDGLEVGGRNYFIPSNVVDLGCAYSDDTYSLISTGACIGFYVPTVAGDVWSLSRSDTTSNNRFDYCFTVDEPAEDVAITGWDSSHGNDLKIEGITVPDGVNYLFLYLSNDSDNDVLPNIKLEKGNRATDWTPSIEDVDSAVLETITKQTASIEQTATGIVANALTEYTTTKALDDYKKEVSSTLEVMSGNINMSFTQTSNYYDDIINRLSAFEKCITFSEEGIIIGSSNSNVTIQVDNEEGVVIKSNNVVLSKLDDNNFYTGNIVVEVEKRAQFGGLAAVPRSAKKLTWMEVSE